MSEVDELMMSQEEEVIIEQSDLKENGLDDGHSTLDSNVQMNESTPCVDNGNTETHSKEIPLKDTGVVGVDDMKIESQIDDDQKEDDDDQKEEMQQSEFCTDADLIESDSDSECKEQLLNILREMPARVYLEKTHVTEAVTLALQTIVKTRPNDAVESVAQFLLRFNHNLKQREAAKCGDKDQSKNEEEHCGDEVDDSEAVENVINADDGDIE